ncbi:hypothetical protein ASPCAL11919 [Aspergillus calidoustus]|uniref:Uncharacterized protein n=1 Tax=Aspergillus calidoustus TaxID=454130 RepID=A0A0U5GAB5_ASPCI|nr:hypothetical protein ASPCAL11919 [Aspergillus calidoustus]
MDLHGLCLEIGNADSGSRHPKIAFFVSPSQAPHITSVIYDLPIPYVVRYSLTENRVEGYNVPRPRPLKVVLP